MKKRSFEERNSERKQPAAQDLHDGSLGDRALLHGVPLSSTPQRTRQLDGGFDLLLPRSHLLLESRNQARSGRSRCSRKISTAAPATQNPQAVGINSQS